MKEEKKNPCKYSHKTGSCQNLFKSYQIFLLRKQLDYSTLQNSFFLPPLPEQPNTNGGVWVSFNVAYLEELVLAAEREKMRKEGVEVWLGAQVEDLRIVCVVHVREYAKELAVDRPDGCGEGRVEGLVL